jgi:hypothetical protein
MKLAREGPIRFSSSSKSEAGSRSAHTVLPPLPGGEGGSRSETGEGSLLSFRSPRECSLLNPRYKFFRRFEHQSVGYLQQTNPLSLEKLLSRAVATLLAGLRVNAALEFHCEALLEAVEINDAVLDRDLPAEFQATAATAPKQIPGQLFRRSLLPPQFTREFGLGPQGKSDPSPALARCPLPRGEGRKWFPGTLLFRSGWRTLALRSTSPGERVLVAGAYLIPALRQYASDMHLSSRTSLSLGKRASRGKSAFLLSQGERVTPGRRTSEGLVRAPGGRPDRDAR